MGRNLVGSQGGPHGPLGSIPRLSAQRGQGVLGGTSGFHPEGRGSTPRARSLSGCGPVWKGARLGRERSQVQILSARLNGLVAESGRRAALRTRWL
jgi:hypothetical protein